MSDYTVHVDTSTTFDSQLKVQQMHVPIHWCGFRVYPASPFPEQSRTTHLKIKVNTHVIVSRNEGSGKVNVVSSPDQRLLNLNRITCFILAFQS